MSRCDRAGLCQVSVALALTPTPLPAHRPLRQGVPAAGWEEDEQKEDGCEEGRP